MPLLSSFFGFCSSEEEFFRSPPFNSLTLRMTGLTPVFAVGVATIGAVRLHEPFAVVIQARIFPKDVHFSLFIPPKWSE
jgi:hypothetical protein